MPESLKDLSDAAQAGIWHTVDTPWGNGDWIVAGNPDPHAGQFVCLFDGSLIGAEADGSFHADPAENAAFVADLVNAYRADRLHDDTALATAAARARREALEEAAKSAEGQLAYWRERMRAEKSLEDGVGEDGEAYTPIGDVAAWQGGYCNGRMGEAEWWIGTLRALAATPPEARQTETGNRQGGA